MPSKLLFVKVLFLLWSVGGIMAGPANSETLSDPCFIARPAVLQVDEHRARLVWVSPSGTEPGSVRFQTGESGSWQQANAQISVPIFQKRDSRDPELIHELDHLRQIVELAGLQPFTEYRYQVECGDGYTTSSGRFVTAPEPGYNGPFDFVMVSDGHTDSQGGRWYGPIAEQVGRTAPAFVVHTGDLTGGRGPDWDRWLTYFNVARPYLQSSVLWPVPGGHDASESARNFRAFFAFDDPGGDPAAEDDRGTWYTFIYGNAQFFILDHTHDLQPQLEWVEQELAGSQARWKIVALHQSEANVGGRGNMFRGLYYDLARIYEQYGVDLVVTGHDHIYERNLPFGGEDTKPVIYLAINSGGNYREIRPSPILVGGIGRHERMFAHFRIHDHRLEMEARRADGTLIDYLELIKDDEGMYQDLVMNQTVDLDLAIELAHIYTGQDVSADLRYARRDLKAEFDRFPVDGQPLIMTLDVSRFPRGSELFFYEQMNPQGWRIEQQSVAIDGNRVQVEIVAPDNLGTTVRSWSADRPEGNWEPWPSFRVNLRLNGRMFESATIWPSLGVGLE